LTSKEQHAPQPDTRPVTQGDARVTASGTVEAIGGPAVAPWRATLLLVACALLLTGIVTTFLPVAFIFPHVGAGVLPFLLMAKASASDASAFPTGVAVGLEFLRWILIGPLFARSLRRHDVEILCAATLLWVPAVWLATSVLLDIANIPLLHMHT
jgi:hypothetical protein